MTRSTACTIYNWWKEKSNLKKESSEIIRKEPKLSKKILQERQQSTEVKQESFKKIAINDSNYEKFIESVSREKIAKKARSYMTSIKF